MSITTLSSIEFKQDVTRARRAADDGPVVITDSGKPAHVLLSYADYLRLTGQRRSIADAIAMPEFDDIDFEPPRAEIGPRSADL